MRTVFGRPTGRPYVETAIEALAKSLRDLKRVAGFIDVGGGSPDSAHNHNRGRTKDITGSASSGARAREDLRCKDVEVGEV